jgi:hypothetical protein
MPKIFAVEVPKRETRCPVKASMQDNAHVRQLCYYLPHTRANYLKINSLFDDPLKKITAISPLAASSFILHSFATNRAICSAFA